MYLKYEEKNILNFEARHSLEAKFEAMPTFEARPKFCLGPTLGQNWGQANFKPGQANGTRPGFVVCREFRANQNTTGGTKWGEGMMKKRTRLDLKPDIYF